MFLLVDLDPAPSGEKRQESKEDDKAADEKPRPLGFGPTDARAEDHDQ